MDIRQKIGQRIHELRIEKKLTQEGLAWEAELNRTYMNHIENGRKNISVETLESITNALGISFHDFFNSSEFKKK